MYQVSLSSLLRGCSLIDLLLLRRRGRRVGRLLGADVLALAELQVLVALLRVAEVHVHLVPVQRSAKVIFLGCVTRPLRPEATHAT